MGILDGESNTEWIMVELYHLERIFLVIRRKMVEIIFTILRLFIIRHSAGRG